MNLHDTNKDASDDIQTMARVVIVLGWIGALALPMVLMFLKAPPVTIIAILFLGVVGAAMAHVFLFACIMLFRVAPILVQIRYAIDRQTSSARHAVTSNSQPGTGSSIEAQDAVILKAWGRPGKL